MHSCFFCGSNLPLDARFCGQCGRMQSTTSLIDAKADDRKNSPAADVQPLPDFSTLGTAPLPSNGEKGGEHTPVSQYPGEEDEKERRGRSLLLDIPLAGSGEPPVADAPMVHGTPQVHGVPAVQGTPLADGGPTLARSLSPGAMPAAPSSLTAAQAVPALAATSKVVGGSAAKWISIVLVSVVVLGVVGVVAGYLLTRPQPVIGVSSNYKVGSTPAGSTGTSFHISGHTFSGTSAITFLLDGVPLPVNRVVQSDKDGNVKADLAVTASWSVGSHNITARDASNYTTKTSVSVVIVPPGQANTPGPNGAPADDASFTLSVNRQDHDTVTGQQLPSFTETLIITGGPGAAGGRVCSSHDDGKPHTSTDKSYNNGTPFTDTSTANCSGTYKGGRLSYTETVTSETVVFSNITCVANKPFIVEQLTGNFISHDTASGTVNFPYVPLQCNQPGASFWHRGEEGTWNGQIVSS